MALGSQSPAEGVNPSLVPVEQVDPSSATSNHDVPPQTIQLWHDVAAGIDRSQTVVWRNAVDTLDAAVTFLPRGSPDARRFVEGHMKPCVSILLDQQPSKIGHMEKNCVEESLKRAVILVAMDLKWKNEASDAEGSTLVECPILDVLAQIMNRKRTYYKGSKPNWNMTLSGAPEVRMQMIHKFRALDGWTNFAVYLERRAERQPEQFPNPEILRQLLGALCDIVPGPPATAKGPLSPQQQEVLSANLEREKVIEDTILRVCNAIMRYINRISEDATLKKQANDVLSKVIYDLRSIFDRFPSSRREETFQFYRFWRNLTLKLITSSSLPIRLYGWDQVNDLIDSSRELRPPPKYFIVEGAGCDFVNGRYAYNGALDDLGYAARGGEPSYMLTTGPGTATKKITLFRCTMRSQQKWWFLSEADEKQPGTDKDIDYYQHKSRPNEDVSVPPSNGWLTCRNSGEEPPPTLRSEGLMVPVGEEYNTLEHQLAKWAIENNIIELVLGDSVHREVVARSQSLIKFLANMCSRDDAPVEISDTDLQKPNAYCLQPSHLLLAWRTCASKADAAVSTEVYALLVSILPSLPDELAIQLLSAIQKSLRDGAYHDKHDLLPEVSEFCTALAKAVPEDNTALGLGAVATGISVSDDVRREILNLLWGVLTHPDAHSIKTYEQLKHYVTRELQVEPNGALHRREFLRSCTKHLAVNADTSLGEIDESVALQKLKLTRFVLEACPRDQAVALVTENNAELPLLLFSEVCAYLGRKNAITNPAAVKRMGTQLNGSVTPLSLRLAFIRYAYGLAPAVFMSSTQLDRLWTLCLSPSDREDLMVFLADAAEDCSTAADGGVQVNDAGSPHPVYSSSTTNGQTVLSSAFSKQVRVHAFQNLVCAGDVSWEVLGMRAYRSFQALFISQRRENSTVNTIEGPDIDALWRICLTSGHDAVATQSMRDLLYVYASASPEQPVSAWNKVGEIESPRPAGLIKAASSRLSDTEEAFIKRIFECLVQVRLGLDAGDPSSDRAAERCLRILNSAVGQEDQSLGAVGNNATHAASLPALDMSTVSTLSEALACVPHGLRGQTSYMTISVFGKRTPQQNQSNNGPVPNRDEEVSSVSSVKLPSTIRFPLSIHPLETLFSMKSKVAEYANHPVGRVKAISINGRQTKNASEMGASTNLNVVAEDTTASQLGITDGCEVMFLLAGQPLPSSGNNSPKKIQSKRRACFDLAKMFAEDVAQDGKDRYFDTLLSVLEALPIHQDENMNNLGAKAKEDSSRLVWDLLLAMPSNPSIVERVRALAGAKLHASVVPVESDDSDAMAVDMPQNNEEWGSMLDGSCLHRSVYTMQVVDSFLQPAPEVLCSIPEPSTKIRLTADMKTESTAFRKGFISTGGFEAFLRLFTQGSNQKNTGSQSRRTRRGDAVALRVLKCCFFGNGIENVILTDGLPELDDIGKTLLENLSKKDSRNLLRRLVEVVVSDPDVCDSTILDALSMARLLLKYQSADDETIYFVNLPDKLSETFVTRLLLRQNTTFMAAASLSTAARVRKSAQELVLSSLQYHALPWLAEALKEINVGSDYTEEFFAVLRELVEGSKGIDPGMLKNLGTATCEKIAAQPQLTNAAAAIDSATGVLCGCLQLIHAIIDSCGGAALVDGAPLLREAAGSKTWSKSSINNTEDAALIDIMSALFDGYLSSAENPSLAPPCCDKLSRQLGFEAVAAAARACESNVGYLALVNRIVEIVNSAAPFLRHRWGVNATDSDNSRAQANVSKYSGLRNQGCTCYMNSFLQQLFMMSDLRKKICSAPIPSSLRSAGGSVVVKGAELVGKRISLQWATGIAYEAVVEGYDELTGMHAIRYCQMPLHTVANRSNTHQQQQIQLHQQRMNEEIQSAPPDMLEEFTLTEGRPGKETGIFDVIVAHENGSAGENSSETIVSEGKAHPEENDEQACARRLLEEIQRTFVHLEEGTRGRCFDPRALVEASTCLKLEFDVWQQNDASEYAMKLLDRLEVPLKRYAPKHFKFLENTFGLKQTKQKLCKECGLKTNREENQMNIDCQIRGKSDIHEALETMCEVEYMEGDNKVFCDRCKKKCDTILRTAISALPDVLVLSLKRFDLDFNTFETVKLNSRLAFGHTLNMKKYTLEGVEALDNAKSNGKDRNSANDGDETMDDWPDPLAALPDEDYEYQLVGVLVHAGVAQGGHYYSYIKDRAPVEGEESEKWYRFDDEDVTPFDPANIEVECFGGKLKKEAKWPNGQVHFVESDQFANALMLFYEKVKKIHGTTNEDNEVSDCSMEEDCNLAEYTNGYDVFQADVRRSNTTHGWHEFLADGEFQIFLKNLLAPCGHTSLSDGDEMDLSPVPHRVSPKADANATWRLALLQVSLRYVFDVLLHSSDKLSVNDWCSRVCNVFDVDMDAAKWLVSELAKRTASISTNWLRKYCTDCPDDTSRKAAIKIIVAAILKYAANEEENLKLHTWIGSWKHQMAVYESGMTTGEISPHPVPTKLQAEWEQLESVDGIGNDTVSTIGIILSALASYTEFCPRLWRFSVDIFYVLRELSCESETIRKALVASQFPARLTCLAVRENCAQPLKAAFPGATLSQDAASLMVRPEGSVSHIMLPQGMGSGNNLQSPKVTERYEPDFLLLYESLACVIGFSCTRRDRILEEMVGPKSRTFLTDKAKDALKTIFEESKSHALNGMGQMEINRYMERCGIDHRAHAAQKIVQKLAKYDSILYREGCKETRVLTLDGFQDYYRDSALANEAQLRSDLNTFGFRPDLSRRPKEARIRKAPEGGYFDTHESVALDVAHLLTHGGLPTQQLGPLAELGMNSYHLYFPPAFHHPQHNKDIGEVLEYILAASSYEKDSSPILIESLELLSQAPTGANGSDLIGTCLMIFKVLLSIPDSKQQERIKTTMLSTHRSHPYAESGVGIMIAAKELSLWRTPQYSTDYHVPSALDRYVELVKILHHLKPVAEWMKQNREYWSWMEQPREPNRVREVLRDGSIHPAAVNVNHPQYSDSDMNQGFGNESEDEEEEFRFDPTENVIPAVPCKKVVVSGAGVQAINGEYHNTGTVDCVPKFTKIGLFEGKEQSFALYRCQLLDRSRKWFISIVPRGVMPGTNKDTDFYWASCNMSDAHGAQLPPREGWTSVKENGKLPVPIVTATVLVPDEEDMVGDSNGVSPENNTDEVWNNGEDLVETDDGRDTGVM